MILVDTSVWIDHLRASEPRLTELLARDEVACHSLVVEELALGSIKNREIVLELLGRLKQCPPLTHDELLTFVAAQAMWGTGLSPTDAHLLGSVLVSPGVQLWTRDKRLKASAMTVGATAVTWR